MSYREPDLDPARAAAAALLYRSQPDHDLSRPCPACPAQPGQQCDGTVIPRFEGMHYARREQPE